MNDFLKRIADERPEKFCIETDQDVPDKWFSDVGIEKGYVYSYSLVSGSNEKKCFAHFFSEETPALLFKLAWG